MSIHVVPCTVDHLKELHPNRDDGRRDETVSAVEKDPDLLEGYALSILDDDRVIGCFGVWPMWPLVGRAWADFSEDALALKGRLHRVCLEELRAFEKDMGFRRIEAVVAADFEVGRRWVERLGFEQEGLMRNFGEGGVGDFVLYARVSDA